MQNESNLIVSVVMITYGHENYIQEAIEGVFFQQFNGTIELIIANDHSPDATDEIVKRVIKNAPQHIKVNYTYHEINKGMIPNFVWALEQAKGKYIAICEGDDYWTDPYKLQKQVDFLEENEDVSLCFHNCNVLFDDKDNIASNNNRGLEVITENRVYESLEILKKWLIPTASVIFRSKDLSTRFFNDIAINRKFIYGDIILFLTIAEKGKLYGDCDTMSVYRRHNGGVTSVVASVEFDKKYSVHLEEIIKVFGVKYKKSIITILGKLYFSLALYSLKNRNIRDSIIALIKTLVYDPKTMFIYLKNRI